MKFEVISSVPVPKEVPPKKDISKRNLVPGSGNTPLYPFRQMQVGDSFTVKPSLAKKARTSAYVFGHRNNVKFKSRWENDGSIRIWRVA